jgi:hypothetical protein
MSSIQDQEVQELDLDYLEMLGPHDEDNNILRNVCTAKRPIQLHQHRCERLNNDIYMPLVRVVIAQLV